MDVNEIIQSYVRDVAACLPRSRRDDVAFELHALLDEELAGRAQAAGHAPDRAMAMALLAEFGRPADAAQRYHARPAPVEATDARHLVIWAVGGAAVLLMHALLNPGTIEVDALFLQWLGLLLVWFVVAGWVRRRRPGAFHWKPSHGPAWMPRGLSALSLVATLVFPVAMYADPVGFAGVLLPASLPLDGLRLDPQFAASWQRMLTFALLLAMAVQHAVALVLGTRPAWLRRVDVALNLGVGLLCVAHASPMGHAGFHVFESAHANEVARPIFLGVGGMMILVALYYAWREWGLIRPAPATGQGAPA
ncbi:hypothetical protein [Pseudoxanthomonas sp. 10H]|uniref:hypothetical protein n=1 Tax=Pseudoxanthomonas sp. 10H TaxID=3242729 RepID=UPI003556BDD8